MNNIEVKDIKNNENCIIDNKEDIIDNSEKFIELREKYTEFHYKSFNIAEDSESINISYVFEISGLSHFEPQLKILKKDLNLKSINSSKKNIILIFIQLSLLFSLIKTYFAAKTMIKHKIDDLSLLKVHTYNVLYEKLLFHARDLKNYTYLKNN